MTANQSQKVWSGGETDPQQLGEWTNYFRLFFIVAAVWNLAGGLPGTLFPAVMFEREFGRVLEDPAFIAIYRGAWGTSLLYGIGWLIVASAPVRHWGIVAIGGLGKALFALNLAGMYLKGWTSEFALLVIFGDALFVLGFIIYFWALRRSGSTFTS